MAQDLSNMLGNFNKSVIGIHGAPRSGTSWLGQIFNSSEYVAYRYQPLFSYAFKGRIGETSSLDEIEGFFSDLLATDDDFVLQRANANLAHYAPTFLKRRPTHLAYKEVRYHHILANLLASGFPCRFIGIVRNPLDVIASWYQAPREFNRNWDIQEEWKYAHKKNLGRKEEFYGLEGWKTVTTMFEDLADTHRERFRLITYESLVFDPESTTRTLFQFANLPVTRQVLDFLRKSTSFNDRDPYGYHRPRGYASTKRNYLPKPVIEKIRRELEGTRHEKYLET